MRTPNPPAGACSRVTIAIGLTAAAFACTKRQQPATQGTMAPVKLDAVPAACAHAACSDHFFVDAVPESCSAGGTCKLDVKLYATGDFHINDDYPYRFKADPVSGVTFLGAGPGDKTVFSKMAGNWQKTGAKAGTMTVAFSPTSPGDKAISGTLKVSVCSEASCLLEQPRISGVVAAR